MHGLPRGGRATPTARALGRVSSVTFLGGALGAAPAVPAADCVGGGHRPPPPGRRRAARNERRSEALARAPVTDSRAPWVPGPQDFPSTRWSSRPAAEESAVITSRTRATRPADGQGRQPEVANGQRRRRTTRLARRSRQSSSTSTPSISRSSSRLGAACRPGATDPPNRHAGNGASGPAGHVPHRHVQSRRSVGSGGRRRRPDPACVSSMPGSTTDSRITHRQRRTQEPTHPCITTQRPPISAPRSRSKLLHSQCHKEQAQNGTPLALR